MKLQLIYTNGKTWKATNVKNYEFTEEEEFWYERYNKHTGIKEAFTIPLDTVAGVAVNNGHSIFIHKVKPRCLAKLAAA